MSAEEKEEEENLQLPSMGSTNSTRHRGMCLRGNGAASDSSDKPSHEQPQFSVVNTATCPTGDYCSPAELSSPQMSSSAAPCDDTDAVPSNPDPHYVQPRQEVTLWTSSSTVPSCSPRPTADEYFQIFIMHREKDERKIEKLKNVLRKFVLLPDGRRLTFSLEEIGVPYIANKFEYFEKSLCRSRYKFIYIADDFDLERDFQHRLHQHYALNEMVKKHDDSVVPMTDNPRTKIPILLDIFKRLDIWKLLRQRSLDEIPDVGALSSEDVDEYTINFISHMFKPTALPTPRVYKTPRHIQLIQTNYRLLTDKMDVDHGLLAELFSKDVISHREMMTVKAGTTIYDRSEELLNIIRQKSEAKFRQFVVALKAFDMTELADSLE